MPVERDPFDILRDNDPVGPTGLPEATSPPAQALFESITSSEPPHGYRRTRRRRWLVAAAASVALLAAAAWALTRDVTEPSVVCYAAADLDSDRVGISTGGVPTVEVCESVWVEGTLTNPTVRATETPPLTGCVTDSGELAVFPTDDPTICERLGLATPTAPPVTSDLAPAVAAQNDLVTYMLSQECISVADAERRVQATLDAHGLHDWTVQTQPPHPQRPCASLAFDNTTQTVLLIPIPTPESSNQG